MMSQAYGSIVTSQSADCIVDANQMVEALNEFHYWTNEGGSWTCFEKKGKQLILYDAGDYYGVEEPCINLMRDSHLYVETEDGELKRISLADASDEDFENAVDFDEEEAQLSEVSKILSRHVQQGWLEIACCSNNKMRYASFDRMRIYSDGTVEIRCFFSSPFFGSRTFKEVFDPLTGETRTEENELVEVDN